MAHTVDHTTRIRYAETDQMGYVYYGNYAVFYEIGRVELFRSLGTSYRELEESGIMMPVYELRSRYLKPAKYDDEIIIRTTVQEIPSARIVFHYEILNLDNEVLNSGETTLVFVDRETDKLIRAPKLIIEPLAKLI